MNLIALLRTLLAAALLLAAGHATAQGQSVPVKKLAYLVSDLRIPFWDIMRRGIATRAEAAGYKLDVYSAENDAKRELEHAAKAIRNNVNGIILSPTNSSAAVTILKMAETAQIPVVIADIGSDGGKFVSYIASDNTQGAYDIGKVLVKTLRARRWDKGSVGIVAIPQKRANGKARTAGFMQALDEAGIKGAGLRQQVDFSYQETFDHAKDLIAATPDLRALWLQGSDRYQGALDAIAAAGKQGEILLVCFDAEPEFIDMIGKGSLVGAAMQQPFLMGEKAVDSMDHHLQGKPVSRQQLLPVLAVSTATLQQQLPVIRRNVLGMGNK